MKKIYIRKKKKITLYEAYRSYKSGNKKAIDDLFYIIAMKSQKQIVSVEYHFNDKTINWMINKCYDNYTETKINNLKDKNGKYKKFTTSVFTGSKDDVTAVYIKNIYLLFNDKHYYNNIYELREELKTMVSADMGESIKAVDTNFEISAIPNPKYETTYRPQKRDYNKAYDHYNNDIPVANRHDKYAYEMWLNDKNTVNNPYYIVDCKCSNITPEYKTNKFTSFMTECLRFIISGNLNEALGLDAVTDRSILKLLSTEKAFNVMYTIEDLEAETNDEIKRKNDKLRLKAYTEIAELYKQTFNKSVHTSQISRALSDFYVILCKRFFGYVPTNRKKFKKEIESIEYDENHDYTKEEIDEIIKQYLTTLYNVHIMLPPNIMNEYINNAITDNKKFVRTFYYFYYNAMLHSIKMTASRFAEKGINLDISEMLYYINYTYIYTEDDEKPKKEKELYWNLTVKKNQVVIDFYKRCYKHCESNAYNLQKNTQIILPGIPDIYLFGNCTVLVMPTTNECLYFASEKRLPYVLRRGSRFYSF